MGILNTSAILDEIGFFPKKRGKAALDEILSENGLSLEETIVELKSIVDNTNDLHLKSKILDIVLNMYGVKDKKEVPMVPTIAFIFPSSEPSFLSGPSALREAELCGRISNQIVDIKIEPAEPKRSSQTQT